VCCRKYAGPSGGREFIEVPRYPTEETLIHKKIAGIQKGDDIPRSEGSHQKFDIAPPGVRT
jgi:hypothetical protein